jgi:hypothetical protein
MTAVYDKLGIRFQYPENWSLDESDAMAGDKSVTVFSPGGAFWTVIIRPSAISPESLVEGALAAMREQYDELDAEAVAETVEGHDLIGYDMNFYCLDLTNTAMVRSYRTKAASLVVLFQADDREFASIEPIFRAMTLSLLR